MDHNMKYLQTGAYLIQNDAWPFLNGHTGKIDEN